MVPEPIRKLSHVYEGTLHGDKVAVKQRVSREASGEERTRLLEACRREAWIWIGLQHANLVSVKAVSLTNPPFIVFEYTPYGSLADVFKEDELELTWVAKLKIMRDVAHGLEYMHTREPRVTHGFITSSKVLVINHIS